MKYLLLFLLATPAFAQSGIVFTWTSNGNSSLPACSATVTESCLTDFTLTDVTPGQTAVVLSSTIAESALTYTESPLPSVGTHTFSLIISGKDQSGNAISSSPITTTVIVPSISLNPPVGLTATP